MIYVLDKPYNQGLYEQWIDVVKRTNVPYKVIVHNRVEADLDYHSYLGNPKTLNNLKNTITDKDLLLIDSSFFQPLEQETRSNINHVQKELGCDIIVFHPDTGFSSNERFGDSVKILSPTYDINESEQSVKDSYNFYLINGGFQELRWLSETVFSRYRQMLRFNKFLSHNGVYKLQRSLIYKTLKENDLLKDTFISYNAYNLFDENVNDMKEWDMKYENHTIEVDDSISEIYSREQHQDVLDDLPIILDYVPNQSNVDQYAFTLPYTSNAYVEIIGCTSISNSTEVYTSEKIFKPFMSFMIPIFVGEYKLCETLKKMGFDLFEGLIDISYDSEPNTVKRLGMAMEQIKKVGSLTIEELHDKYHGEFEHGLVHNYNLMRNLATNQVDTIKTLIEDYKTTAI